MFKKADAGVVMMSGYAATTPSGGGDETEEGA